MCHMKGTGTLLTPKNWNTIKVSQIHTWVRRLNYEMNTYGCGVYVIAQLTILWWAIIKWAIRVLPTSHHFLSTPLLGLLTITSDFARYSAIVPMSLIPPTFFAENGFLQPMTCLRPYCSLFSFCLGNISQSYVRTQGLGKGTYGNALVDITFKNYLDSSSSCSSYTHKQPREEAVGGIRGQRRAGCAREESANCSNSLWQITYYQQMMRCKSFL